MDHNQISNDQHNKISLAPGTKPASEKGKNDLAALASATEEWLSGKDLLYALEMSVACAISYWIITAGLGRFVDKPSDLLGGMWAVIATVFVFRDTSCDSTYAGLSRLIATCVSFCLCVFYLLLLPFHPIGLAVLIGIGTLVMMLLDRREDIITTGITTTVVMVAAAISPQDAWQQPFLRLIDTIVGITVGIGCLRIASVLRTGTPENRPPMKADLRR